MKNILKILREQSDDPNEKDDNILIVREFFAHLREYWHFYDIDNETHHEEIFIALYLLEENMTYNEIANKFYISKRSLDRYIIKYNAFAAKMIEKEDLFKREVLCEKLSKVK